jgi:hypothetical protein
MIPALPLSQSIGNKHSRLIETTYKSNAESDYTEKIEQLNRHKIAFKHLWVDLSVRIPPEVLMYDVTFVDRMITYQHYLNYAMGYGVII